MTDDIEKKIQQATERGLVGRYPIVEVWHLLDDVDYIVPWIATHSGSPNVYRVWDDVAPQLKSQNIHLYRHLKHLVAELAVYDHVNFYARR